MPIHFRCPVCKEPYSVANGDAGKKLACTKCNQRIQVPAPPRSKTVLGEAIEPAPERVTPLEEPPPMRKKAVPSEPRRESRNSDDGYRLGRSSTAFGNEEAVRIVTDLSGPEIEEIIRREFERLGYASFHGRGSFDVSVSRHRNFATNIRMEGELCRERKPGEWTVSVNYSVQPSGACWAIGIIFFVLLLIGPLIFLMPLLAKNEVQRSLSQVLRDIRNEAEARDEDRR